MSDKDRNEKVRGSKDHTQGDSGKAQPAWRRLEDLREARELEQTIGGDRWDDEDE